MMNYGGNDPIEESSSSEFTSDEDKTPSPDFLPMQRRMFRGRDRAGGRDTVSLINIQFNP